MDKTVYFKGYSGIKDPVDVDGKIIYEGDTLTFSWWWEGSGRDSNNPTDEEMEPCLIVKRHKSGGLFAEGIHKKLYNHDFTFKYTKNLSI